MEWVNTLTQFVGTVGFPIVCCVFLWRFISETITGFTKTINENTKILEKVAERLDDLKGGLHGANVG